MLNNTGFTEKEYGNAVMILSAPELAYTIGCIVDDTGVVAGANGKKIIPAGTVIGGATKIISSVANRQSPLSVITADTQENAQGVLVNDVDVTKGQNNGTILLHGFVRRDVVPTPPGTSETVLAPHIMFVAGM